MQITRQLYKLREAVNVNKKSQIISDKTNCRCCCCYYYKFLFLLN